MKDSEIPEFTDKVLRACKQDSKNYSPPLPPGNFNNYWCPLQAHSTIFHEYATEKSELRASFMRGYDLIPEEISDDHRFYILGQGFREIAIATRFSEP